VAEEGKPKKKHTPGRGHRRKTDPRKKDRFRKSAAAKRQKKIALLRQQWAEWDTMPPEEQKLRPNKKPNRPRPKNED
jgi:hypothetical protein